MLHSMNGVVQDCEEIWESQMSATRETAWGTYVESCAESSSLMYRAAVDLESRATEALFRPPKSYDGGFRRVPATVSTLHFAFSIRTGGG